MSSVKINELNNSDTYIYAINCEEIKQITGGIIFSKISLTLYSGGEDGKVIHIK
ncbi:hypothetical protein [Crocosphaera chwakensis]|uniref:Uncharacterized protein n=1 Tax=Crocosphaera chwakensis CCY0110 TaxID=391612 RepID=A3IKR6_9CHRO|nr:hypothetical protein [Crocosphaera chwakensis]EAZ92785.1 hypothetical protein CY0110_21852 [Crocosphaera chwakensis CCY0110]